MCDDGEKKAERANGFERDGEEGSAFDGQARHARC